jgi:hypothetical protein
MCKIFLLTPFEGKYPKQFIGADSAHHLHQLKAAKRKLFLEPLAIEILLWLTSLLMHMARTLVVKSPGNQILSGNFIKIE